MNIPHFMFFAKLTQSWCNVVIPTSRRRFDYVVRRCHYNICEITTSNAEATSVKLCKYDVWMLIDAAKTLWVWRCDFKGATKFYFMHSLCVVIILFNTDWYKSVFSNCSLKKCFFLFCFEFDAIFWDFLYNICANNKILNITNG